MFDDHDDQLDEELARELLAILGEDFPEPPEELPDRTIRKVEAELTSRDLLDLTTLVFLTSFCAPILDLLAAFFGADSVRQPRTRGASRGAASSPSADPASTRSELSANESPANDAIANDAGTNDARKNDSRTNDSRTNDLPSSNDTSRDRQDE